MNDILVIPGVFKCWHCREVVSDKICKESPLGKAFGLECNWCGKDLSEWYLRKGLITATQIHKKTLPNKMR